MKMDNNACKEKFLELLRSTGRAGVEDAISELESNGFFEAPASAGHHLNVEGGLLQHSVNTCDAALAIWEAMKPLEPSLEKEVKRENVIIASLLHDVCKSDLYVRSAKKRKNSIGQWETVEGYRASYKSFPMGHGEKSVVMLLFSGIELTDEEMLAIRWHMGPWDLNFNSFEQQHNYDAAGTLYPLVSIIHTADTLAARILERNSEEIDDL